MQVSRLFLTPIYIAESALLGLGFIGAGIVELPTCRRPAL